MKNTECGICGGEAVLTSEEREVWIGKRSAVVEDQFFRCSVCGEELYEPGQMDAVMLRASTAIRADLGLMMPEEIRELRESLALSQADFERLLGVGEKTVVRWEKGTVFQNQATDALLSALRDVAGVAAYLSARTDVVVSKPAQHIELTAFGGVVPVFTRIGDELRQFGLSAELLEHDQFVTGPEGPTYPVETGGFETEEAA